MEEQSYRVLSIQSHVVSGYVGNKSACFPLQLLGFEVDFINSVQLSNHTGYKHIKGQILKSEDVEELYVGLKANGLLKYTHVLTGYVGNVTFLTKLVEIVKDLKERNPGLIFVCDPVLGDDGKLYVPKELLPVYRDTVIPVSDLITPNQYEAELLSGIPIKSKDDVLKTIEYFHGKGVKMVVLSSVQLQSEEKLILFGSSIASNPKTLVSMEIPKLPSSFTGVGDLFSALLLAWMTKTNGDLRASCEKTINSMQCVLMRTLEYSSGQGDPTSPASLELKLIQSKKDIETPPSNLKCYLL